MSSIRQFVFQDDKLTNCQRCNSCVSCYYFIIVVTFIVLWLGGIVSVVCSIVLSKGFKPFMWDLTRAATWPEIVRSGSLTDASYKLYIFMCLSGYWQWNLTNEPERISVLIVKTFFLFVTDYKALTMYDHAARLKSRNNRLSYKTLHVVANTNKIVNVKFNSSS